MEDFDSRDRKIFNILADNGRMSYSEIAKKTKISKDSVRSRLLNLESRKFILSFMPLINYHKLGYTLFHAYIQFKPSLIHEAAFLKNTMKNGYVVGVTRVIGRWDFELQVLGRNVFDLYDHLDNIFGDFKNDISDLRVITSLQYHQYTFNIGKFMDEKDWQLHPVKEDTTKIDIDKKDVEILKRLSVNSREPLTKISKYVDLSPDVVRYRIKNFIEKGVIKGFHARTNKHRFGLSSYIFLLDISGKINREDLAFFHQIRNIFHIKSCLGNWNLNLGFYSEDNTHLFYTIARIRKHFMERLNRFDLLILLERHKYTPIPKNFVLQ